MKAITIKESDIEAYLVRRVKAVGGIAYKFTSPARRAVPDRMICLPDVPVFFVECKSLGKKLTPAQEREKSKLRKLGKMVYMADSKESVDFILFAEKGDE